MKNLITYINEGFKIGKTKAKSYYTFQPKDRDELKKIIKERLKEDKNADLNDIDVSNINNMSNLFFMLDPHNINVSGWDMSNVEDTNGMFYNCSSFNCDLSNWDVSKVIDMGYMFYECEKFDSDLSNWNTSNVVHMKGALRHCISLKNKPSWYKEK